MFSNHSIKIDELDKRLDIHEEMIIKINENNQNNNLGIDQVQEMIEFAKKECNINTEKVSNEIVKTNDNLKDLDKEIRKNTLELKSIKRSVQDNTNNLQILNNSLSQHKEDTKDKFEDITNDITDIKTDIQTNVTSINSLDSKISNLENNIIPTDLIQRINTLETTSNSHESKIQQNTLNITNLNTDVKNNITNINTNTNSIQETNNKVDQLDQKIDSMFQKYHQNLIEKLYPIGSLYITADKGVTDPNIVLGVNFKWETLEDGCGLLTSITETGRISGKNTINIDHSHKIDFQFGYTNGMPNLWTDDSFPYGFSTSYDDSNNPVRWTNAGSNTGADVVCYAPKSVIDSTWTSTKSNFYRLTGTTGHQFKNRPIDITGKTLKVKIFRRSG